MVGLAGLCGCAVVSENPGLKEKTIEEERRQFGFLPELMMTQEVPLSALWNFDFEHPAQVLYNIAEANHRA